MTPVGLYCPLGGFHIDPWRPVTRAVITHAHGDHARRGSRHYHAPLAGLGLLRRRLGPEAIVEGHGFGEPLTLGDTTVSSHPEGINRSIALRFPRIARWRADEPAYQADRLVDLHALPETIRGGPG